MSSSYGIKQLEMIRDIGKYKFTLLDGPFGCGKTYGAEVSLGFLCRKLQLEGVKGLRICLLGQSIGKVKSNQCDVLANCFGKDFRYDSSKKDGYTKDAVLFDQHLFFIGLNDKNSVKRFQGLSNIFCIIHDEVALSTREHFDLINGRLRAEFKPHEYEVFKKLGIEPCFYVGSTNPDSPVHWLKKLIDDNFFHYVHWEMSDARWKGAEEYYERLKRLYAGNEVLTGRYLRGEWTSSEGMVWSAFNYKNNVINSDEVDVDYKSFERIIVGIDWGSSHNTSLAVVGYSSSDVYVCLEEYHWNNLSPSELVEQILPILNKLPFINNIYVDGAGKAYNDELRKHNVVFLNAIKDHVYIPKINSLFANCRLYILSNLNHLITQIFSYKYKENSTDDSIDRHDDDSCDALRYAVVSDMVNHGE